MMDYLAESKALAEEARRMEVQARTMMRGLYVRILSDYNGQPYGRSKPSLKGQVRQVTGALFSSGCLYLGLKGESLYIDANEVEVATKITTYELQPVEDRTSEQSGAEHGSLPATDT